MYRVILLTALLVIYIGSCFAQKDSLSKPIVLHNDSSISFYKQSHILWLSSASLYKINDSVYSTKELKPFLMTDAKAHNSYRAYKTNVLAGGIFTGMFLGGVVAVAEGLANKRNVLPALCLTPVAFWLSGFFQKKASQRLKKAVTIYNARF